MKTNLQTGLPNLYELSTGIWKDYTTPISYEAYYWENYVKLDNTDMGEKLTKARVDFVRSFTDDTIVDIGIGGGRFVKEVAGLGYDINQSAVSWLKDEGLFFDVENNSSIKSATFWDSLEHIPSPNDCLDKIENMVFVSIPIFKDLNHISNSKHYKPGEHLWYFTHEGFINYMELHGFELVSYNQMETDLGREGINTYAFRRLL